MADFHKLHVDDIGIIVFARSAKARHISISIKPFNGIRVAVPNRVSFKAAREFVDLKKPWIQKHLAKVKQIESRSQTINSVLIADKSKAKNKLNDRLKYLAALHGFTYNKIVIRNQKTRWGSCSHKNNISLNIKLVLLPDELLNFVILHELVHTKIPNHSKNFWAELDKYVGHAKSLDKRLKEFFPS